MATKGHILGITVLTLFIVPAFFAFPAPVEAGFLSSLSGIFSKAKDVASDERPVNSQSMALLQAAVNPDPNPAKGGGDITIVGGTALLSENGPSGTIVDVEDKPSSDHISIYVVREGDSLSDIAKMFGVSVNTIVWANDIKRGVITPGQTLVILPISGVEHTVVKGETLAGVAKKFKADAQEIAQYNNLDENAPLAVGEIIIIPDGEVVVTPTSSGSVPTSKLRGAGGPRYDGYYIRPITGGHKSQGLHGYNGVDLADAVGTPVLASAAGTVIISKNYGYNGGYGSYIVIQHNNGTQTLYGHLSANLVYEGAQVFQGQIIGRIGMTGKTTGPHVHFEIRGAANPF